MFKAKNYKWHIQLTLSVISVVLILIIIFFLLTSNSIITLTKNNMSLRSDNCANQLDLWTDSVINELGIYKKTIEDNFYEEEELEKFLVTTYQVHDAYPMGIYVGDENGMYVDASGWVPDYSEWVLEERPWYIDGKESYDFVFGEPYVDSMTKTLCISASARVKCPNTIRVMSTDVYLDYAKQLVNDIVKNSSIDGAMFVTDEDRIVIADSMYDVAGNTLENGDEFYKIINSFLKDEEVLQSEVNFNNSTYYIHVKQMNSTGWYLVTYVKKNTILGYLYKVEFIMGLVAVVVAVLLLFITRGYAGKMSDMQRKAKTDKLTKILNREGFEEIVEKSLSDNPGKGALIILDMDNFKSINDNLGHPEGDKVLRLCADILENFFNRKNDAAARIGGDEFALFISRDINYDSLNAMLERLMDKMKSNFDADYAQYQLSVSMGAAFARHGTLYSELYQLADDALYEVKRGGKNKFKINLKN